VFNITRPTHYKAVKALEYEEFSNAIILEMIQECRRINKFEGGRKLFFRLKDEINRITKMGRDKFFTLLRDNKLLIERKKSFTRTTDSNHPFRKYTNQIKDLTITRKNQVWVSDITYIRTAKSFRYLSLITDLYSRKIVGYKLSNSLSIEGCIDALKGALKLWKGTEPLIHHSDRGVQYCCKEYTELLINKGISISMTEVDHCYENACAERVNGILKQEYGLDATFNNEQQALKAVKEAINLYNSYRLHTSLGYKTPDSMYFAEVA
jgi:integrase